MDYCRFELYKKVICMQLAKYRGMVKININALFDLVDYAVIDY